MTDLDRLARWRAVGARHSEHVVHLAEKVLRAGGLGNQEWSVREQLALAALDIGQIKLATVQIVKLQKQFQGSPRVALLTGLRNEAQGDIEAARKGYEALLAEDETNVSAHQRLIALSMSNPPVAIQRLLLYLDIFYTDPAGWSLLAEMYADQGLYAQSLAALGHIMIVQNWDSGAVCRAGETAYTMGDYNLALKYFLRATEMQTDPSRPETSGPGKTRSWWGVRLSTRRLLEDSSSGKSIPAESATSPAQLQALDQLATERLLAAGGSCMSARRSVLSASPASIR